MQNGYYAATGAMVTQFNRLDVIANNLANLNTTAFKRDDVVVGDFKRIFQEAKDELPLKDNTKEGAKFLNASISRVPQVAEQYVQFHQGGFKSTGNSLDFALKREDTFFLVETPNGLKLTQNGSFAINSEGNLATKEGYPVLPSTYFTDKAYTKVDENLPLNADKSGNLYVDGETAGKFYLAQVADLKWLAKEGDNFYTFRTEEDFSDLENADVISQGFLETSNINPVSEMVGLIEANRMVEMYQKVMHSHMNDVNTDAINKLATTRV
ncbi:MAG: flagellar hook-basal body protein [Sulfurospirillaceae bacterium]|nr:flagellar hook-basal body protein [Sulfurospirillaceae bacterium]